MSKVWPKNSQNLKVHSLNNLTCFLGMKLQQYYNKLGALVHVQCMLAADHCLYGEKPLISVLFSSVYEFLDQHC